MTKDAWVKAMARGLAAAGEVELSSDDLFLIEFGIDACLKALTDPDFPGSDVALAAVNMERKMRIQKKTGRKE